MQVLPPALNDLIDAFGMLPGVGPRSAERYAYYVVRSNQANPERLASALINIKNGIGYCEKTFALVSKDQKLSDLYTDPRRDKTVIAVVAEPFDILPLEKLANLTAHTMF